MTHETSFRREDLFYFTDRYKSGRANGLPRPADAYTAAATYESKTPATRTTVLRILEHRANNLVREQTSSFDDPFGAVFVNTATHLARTQALLVYAIIRLFDGDIGSRNDADNHLQTLVAWAELLLQSAELDISTSRMGTDSPLPSTNFGVSADKWTKERLRTDGRLPSTKRAWVFSESIRRTWYAVMRTESVYSMLKRGWARCHGSLPFMGGKRLWDAPTSYTRPDALRTDSVSVVQSLTDPRLLSGVPSTIDSNW